VQAEPVNDHLLIDLPAGATAAVLWETAERADEQIRSLRPRRSTLEEVFLRALAEPS
jgi:ABC-2 type transport system ATP-binding protein